jgi:hypothetical protein
VDDDGHPKMLPWEDWSDADDVVPNTSAWMRATSPSGSAEFEGRISWSGELGFGTRAAELGQPGDTYRPSGEGSASDEPQSSEARERDHEQGHH